MNFTLLTSYLFNSFASGVMNSTGLHGNMKMSQKLHQNGNAATRSHEAFSEPTLCMRTSSARRWVKDTGLKPICPFVTEDSENLQRRQDPQSPLPMHFTISKYVNKS